MFGESHDIPHEFPEYQHVINLLHETHPEFQRMYSEYHDIDTEIRNIEQNIEPVSDYYTETLKKKRVYLKDKIYTILKSHCRTANTPSLA